MTVVCWYGKILINISVIRNNLSKILPLYVASRTLRLIYICFKALHLRILLLVKNDSCFLLVTDKKNLLVFRYLG